MSVASPQSFNRYSYVENNPVNSVDPTGLMLSDIGALQTEDPEEAKIAEHQSLRDLQTSVNANYAANHSMPFPFIDTPDNHMDPAAAPWPSPTHDKILRGSLDDKDFDLTEEELNQTFLGSREVDWGDSISSTGQRT